MVVTVAALVASFLLVANVFDDLDLQSVLEAIGSLSDAERIALASGFILDLGAQGLLTASLVANLPVRRGVLAFLGPTAVASVIPGPSDLPVRHRMYQSWGRSSSEAALALTANGLFSIGSKLLLPIVAGPILLVVDFPATGIGRIIGIAAVCLAVGIAAITLIASSERRVRWVGGLLESPWQLTLRLLRRQNDDANLSDSLASLRSRAVDLLRDRWLIATWAAFLTVVTRFALLLMCLRFTGVSESDLGSGQAFIAFAVVQGLTVVPITAGGAGVTETAFIGLLVAAAGASQVNEVTAAVVVFRLLTWILLIPIGLVALGIWRYRTKLAPSTTS